MTFLDEASGHIRGFSIKPMNEAADQLVKYVSWVERQTGKKVKTVTMDGAENSEYSKAVQLLGLDGIVFTVCAPYTSAENGRAERVNRTLNNAIRAMLSHSGMPDEFWAECLLTAVDVRHFIPKSDKDKSPFKELTGSQPSAGRLHVFGSRVQARIANMARE